MQLVFTDTNDRDNSFTLGSVSFNWLDTHDVFDKYQRNHDEYSDTICEVWKEDITALTTDVYTCIALDDKVRINILAKLTKFAEWLPNTKGFTAEIR